MRLRDPHPVDRHHKVDRTQQDMQRDAHWLRDQSIKPEALDEEGGGYREGVRGEGLDEGPGEAAHILILAHCPIFSNRPTRQGNLQAMCVKVVQDKAHVGYDEDDHAEVEEAPVVLLTRPVFCG